MEKEIQKRSKKIILTILYGLSAITILWFIFLFILSLIIQPYSVTGNSMNQTLLNNEIIATYKKKKDFNRGDILVVKKEGMKNCPENEKDELLIKRVVALPGDEIVFVLNNDSVDLYMKENGSWVVIDEPYTKKPVSKDAFINFKYLYESVDDITESIKIEENQIYILGDNRNNSNDSREYGTFDINYICNVYWFNISKNSFFNFVYSIFL